MPLSVAFVVIVHAVLMHAAAFEGLLQAAGEVRKDRAAVPLRFASPDWSVYHRTQHLETRLASLISSCKSASHLLVRAPSLTSQAQHSTVNQPAPPEDETDSLRYVTIAHRPSPAELAGRIIRRRRRTRAMFVFGETGRDFLSSEIALRVVEAACASNATQVLPGALSDIELVLVPLANPAGRRIAEMGRRCERTNANDVDLDSNWPRFWNEPTRIRDQPQDSLRRAGAIRDAGRVLGVSLSRHVTPPRGGVNSRSGVADVGTGHTGSSPLRAGTEPFSEPETRALRSIVDKLKPASYVSVRTGAVAVTIPWDCRSDALPEAQRSRLLRVAQGITASHCTKCETGNLWNATGRTKCGTAADYMYGTVQIPFVHTWHVYNFPQAAKGDCFRRHNPTTKEGYERVVNNWAQAVFNFTTAVQNWVTLESSVGLNSAEQNASLAAADASARRADAIARGMPDPEKMEELERSKIEQWAHNGKPAANDAGPAPGGTPVKRFRLFSWIFEGKTEVQEAIPAHPQSRQRIGPNAASTHRRGSGDDKVGLLAGWIGAFAAIFLLAGGMFVARRYVFKIHSKKSLFRARRPVKNA